MKRLGIILVLGMLAARVLAVEPAFVELESPRQENPWVGQRINFAVNVLVAGRFDGSTVFDLPQVPGAILMKPEERAILSARTIGEVEYSVQRHEFALFCQTDQKMVIPAFRVRCRSVPAFGLPPREHRLDVPSFSVQARLPDGAKRGQVVVTTARLAVTENWDPQPGPAKPGDAFKRVVMFTATDVPAMLLPRLPQPALEGVAVYRGNPRVEDRTQRGEFTGTKSETITYVCERPGTFTVPAITVRWWDPAKQIWQSQVLPEVTWDVVGAMSPGVTEESVTDKPGRSWPWWAYAVIGLGLAGVLYGFVARRIAVDPEEKAFRDVLAGCRAHDPSRVYRAVKRWQKEAGTGDLPSDVMTQLEAVQRAMIGFESGWRGDALAATLKQWRGTWQRGVQQGHHTGALAGLNPAPE